ncbi:hypothetical protein [Natronosalvus vescus]|uniref:hypothetical protein n=1 Tax=Natronosalvus vescus TaxID=2953881 RepID=UPI0020908BCC|nr:hypothetical protein [Natronosalvus vescus]
MTAKPIDGQILLLTAAKASVPASSLPNLIEQAQRQLVANLEQYQRSAECVFEDDDRAVFLVELGHWDEIGSKLGFTDRETAAVRRAHTEQLERIGRRQERDDEFESALEIREVVCIGHTGASSQ